MRALIVAAQHVRVTLVVENRDRRADDADRLGIGAVGEIKAAQAIIRGGETEPGLRVARMLFDCGAEMFFGKTEIIRAKVFLPRLNSSFGSLPSRPGSAAAGTPSGGGTEPVGSSPRFRQPAAARTAAVAGCADAASDGVFASRSRKNYWTLCIPPTTGPRR